VRPPGRRRGWPNLVVGIHGAVVGAFLDLGFGGGAAFGVGVAAVGEGVLLEDLGLRAVGAAGEDDEVYAAVAGAAGFGVVGAEESSQLEGKVRERMGTLSVWPSTRSWLLYLISLVASSERMA
jgi:hypothetical protein